MRSYDHKHPKGNKYTESELKRHRDSWYGKVAGNIGTANRAEVVETDKEVFRLVARILPWDGSIDFIRRNHFEGSFDGDHLKDLYDFEWQCHNPAFEFIDPDLEGLRVQLRHNIQGFRDAVGSNTFSTGYGRNSVPAEWETEQPDLFKRAVGELHATADEIISTYGNLVRTATRKLGILPHQGDFP